MTLQAPTLRDEERFEFDEPISISSRRGRSTGRAGDIAFRRSHYGRQNAR